MNLNPEKTRIITDTVLEDTHIDTVLKRQQLTVAGQAALIHAMIQVYVVSEEERTTDDTTRSDAMIAKIHSEQHWMETTQVMNHKSFPAIMQAIRLAVNGLGLSTNDLIEQITLAENHPDQPKIAS